MDADGGGVQHLKNGAALLDIANELVAKYDKDYPLRFYSAERLFYDEARVGFVPGDVVFIDAFYAA